LNFTLVDRIAELIPGKTICTIKQVSMAEEYLADHFPGFPVLPGVMMLESAVEAAAWLVHEHTQFTKSLVVLKEARQIRYGNFVAPGETLVITAEAIRMSPSDSEFKIKGIVANATAIQGRLTLLHVNLSDSDAAMARIDEQIIQRRKARWAILQPPPRGHGGDGSNN
jgi:3-hydroxyacyl-[acyl-carrier-protein] dehydratase